jgi:hemolysin D
MTAPTVAPSNIRPIKLASPQGPGVSIAFGPGRPATSDGQRPPPPCPVAPRVELVRCKDTEFLAPALAIIETPPSPLRQWLLLAICGAFSFAIAWSFVSKLDIIASAQGRVQLSGFSKVLQPLEAGRVRAVHVRNGQSVAAGEVLIELDQTETEAERQALAHDVQSLEAEIARRTAVVEWARGGRTAPIRVAFPAGLGPEIQQQQMRVLAAETGQFEASLSTLAAQVEELETQRARFEGSIEARKRLIAVLKERVDTRSYLDSRGGGYRARVIDALQEYERVRTELASEEGQVAETSAHIKSLRQKIDETIATFIAEQNRAQLDAERRQVRLKEDLVKAMSRNEQKVLVAPVAGTVQQLAITTVGQVVGAGQVLLTIVPTGKPIEVEALVLNKDIGFVDIGQRVVVKVEAFPFTRYGTIEGIVTRVSRDAVDRREATTLTDAQGATRSADVARRQNEAINGLVFPVTIELARDAIQIDGKNIPLVPGMAVMAEIKTGERRAIDYVLSPVREVIAASGHER